MINTLKKRDFTLVLSGGGALGIAHLGVYSDIEESGLVPSEIVGTSMGAIIGACIAIGMSEKEIFEEIQELSKIYNWINFTYSSKAIIDNKKIIKILDSIFGETKISEAKIPLKIIATNLQSGNKKVFCSSDDILITDAVLCSMAIPGIFNEHVVDGEVYGDGFLCENLGINEASYDDILAVDVVGKNSFNKPLPDKFFKTANVLGMFERSMRLIIYNQTMTHIKHSTKKIHLIEPETREFQTFSFHKFNQIKAVGLGLLK